MLEKNSKENLSIDVNIQFTENSSNYNSVKIINLNENLPKNNSQQENSKEKLSVDVTA